MRSTTLISPIEQDFKVIEKTVNQALSHYSLTVIRIKHFHIGQRVVRA
jgi:hypothetical protein